MDQPHFSSQLEYLEQRYLADQEKIARLQQQAESQAYLLQEQSQRIQKLEESLAQARLTIARVPQLDEQLINFKSEVLHTLEQRYSQRNQTTVNAGQALTSQLEGHTKILNELRRDVDKTQRYDEQILLARTEVERLNKFVSIFEARFDELNKKVDARTE
jgi:hypothetical protein